MGPGITAEPHCAEREITGLRFLPTLHPEGKASAFHDPCALAQASRRSRSADRSPGLFPAASAPFRPCGLSLASTRLCRRFPDQQRRSEDPCSLTVRLRRSWSSPPLRISFTPKSAASFQASVPVLDLLLSLSLASQFQLQVATNRPFAALLGMVVFRAALITPLRGTRPAAVRRSSLPAPLAGFASKILRPAPIRHPGEAQSSQHRSPLRRRAGGDRKFLSFPAA